jgi:hypothetical protein
LHLICDHLLFQIAKLSFASLDLILTDQSTCSVVALTKSKPYSPPGGCCVVWEGGAVRLLPIPIGYFSYF